MKRPLKVAAWSGILSAVLSLILFVLIATERLSAASSTYNWIVIIISLLSVFFVYGFVVLAKKFNSILLLVMSWIGIVIVLTSVVFVAYSSLANAQELGNNSSAQTGALLLVWFFLSVFMGTYSVLFGVGLLKIANKVEKAKIAGILEIIAGATFIIFVGFFIKLAAFVFELIVLFKASKKLEK